VNLAVLTLSLLLVSTALAEPVPIVKPAAGGAKKLVRVEFAPVRQFSVLDQ
jgi:hypothetical protein